MQLRLPLYCGGKNIALFTHGGWLASLAGGRKCLPCRRLRSRPRGLCSIELVNKTPFLHIGGRIPLLSLALHRRSLSSTFPPNCTPCRGPFARAKIGHAAIDQSPAQVGCKAISLRVCGKNVGREHGPVPVAVFAGRPAGMSFPACRLTPAAVRGTCAGRRARRACRPAAGLRRPVARR
jgi:hypothetical protein